MRFARLWAIAFAFSAAAGSPLAIAQPAATPARVPSQQAADLNGRTLNVPADLGTKPALWLIAFEREQQREVDRLFALVAPLQKADPALQVWEIPVIEDPGSVVRFFIDNGMKNGIPSTTTRGRVVTLYVASRTAWLRTTGLPSAKESIAAVVAPDGRIMGWRMQSEIADQAALRALIETTRR